MERPPRLDWGDNLPRPMAAKGQHDPQNLFRHVRSVPLPPAAPPQA